MTNQNPSAEPRDHAHDFGPRVSPGDFVPARYSALRFTGYDSDTATGTVAFRYTLVPVGGEVQPVEFVETVTFELPADAASADWDAAGPVLPLLGAVLGLSYYKTAAPPVYELDVDGLTTEAHHFISDALRHGLAEFAYRAGLSGLLETAIPALRPRAVAASPRQLDSELLATPLVPIGGGKDSVVTVESLRAAGLTITQFSVNPNAIMRAVAAVSGDRFIAARRTIDPLLLQLNSCGEVGS